MKQQRILDYFSKRPCSECKKPMLKSICVSCEERRKRIAERKERRELRVSGSACWKIFFHDDED